MVKMNIKCRLFGHKIDLNFIDGEYHICERCQMHEYWESSDFMRGNKIEFQHSFNDAGLLLQPVFYVTKKINHIKHRLQDYMKGFLNKKNNDLPF